MKKLVAIITLVLFCLGTPIHAALELRYNTATTRRIGSFVQYNTGVSPVDTVDLTSVDKAEILKGTAGALTTDISGRGFKVVAGASGWYNLGLLASDTDTTGPLVVVVQDDDLVCPVHVYFEVVSQNYYDSKYGTVEYFDVDVNNVTNGVSNPSVDVATGVSNPSVDVATVSGGVSNPSVDVATVSGGVSNPSVTVAAGVSNPSVDVATVSGGVSNPSVTVANGVSNPSVDVATVSGGVSNPGVTVIAGVSNPAVTITAASTSSIATVVHDYVVEGTTTSKQMDRLVFATMVGTSGGGGTTSVKFNAGDGGKLRITATVDASGNRSAVTTDVTD
jgi:hypothetical protein